MNSLVKSHNNLSLWNDPFNRFFRNNFMDLWNKNLTDTIPSLNISEEKDKYKVELAAPGLKKEDLNIDVNGNFITVSSEKEHESTNGKDEKDGHAYSRREYNYSSFSRSFSLPDNADSEAVKAKYCDGVLCLDIPKKKQAIDKSSKKIHID